MNSPHTVSFDYDLMDEHGRVEFDYARLGKNSHLVIWELWDWLVCQINDEERTELEPTLDQLLLYMDDHEVPLEVG